jgi:predicted DNA-binding transcriptional regulator AlpA
MQTEILDDLTSKPRPRLSDDCLITAKQVREILGGISETHIWRLLNHPNYAALRFPRAIKINRRNYWKIVEIREFIGRQAARSIGKCVA